MKNLTLLFILISAAITGFAQKTKLSKSERDFAANYLLQTHELLLNAVKEVDGELWTYQPSVNSWSVAGCFEHIVFAEGVIYEKINKMISGEPNNNENLAYNDAVIIAKVADRSKKAKTPEFFEPNGRWTSKSEMIKELESARNELMSFVKNTKADLRSFKATSPVGEADAYQHILELAGHTLRHTMQIKEIIADFNQTTASK